MPPYTVEFPPEEDTDMQNVSLMVHEEKNLATTLQKGLVIRKRKSPLAICAEAELGDEANKKQKGEDLVLPAYSQFHGEFGTFSIGSTGSKSTQVAIVSTGSTGPVSTGSKSMKAEEADLPMPPTS